MGIEWTKPFPNLEEYRGGLGLKAKKNKQKEKASYLPGIRTFYFQVMKNIFKQNNKIISSFVVAYQQYRETKDNLQNLAHQYGIAHVRPDKAEEPYKGFSEQYPDKALAMILFNQMEEYYLNEMINDPEFRETIYEEKHLSDYWNKIKPDSVSKEQWNSLLEKITPEDRTDLDAWNEKWDQLSTDPWLRELLENTGEEDWKAMSPGRSVEKLMISYYNSYPSKIPNKGINLDEAIVIKMIGDYYNPFTSRRTKRRLAKNMKKIDLKYNYTSVFKTFIKDLLKQQKPLETRAGKQILKDYEKVIPDPKYSRERINRVFNLPIKRWWFGRRKKKAAFQAFSDLWKNEDFLRAYAKSDRKLIDEKTPVR